MISAGIVNIFVPSGGGQWAVQAPIILEAAYELGVSFEKTIMAFIYGDQLTLICYSHFGHYHFLVLLD